MNSGKSYLVHDVNLYAELCVRWGIIYLFIYLFKDDKLAPAKTGRLDLII